MPADYLDIAFACLYTDVDDGVTRVAWSLQPDFNLGGPYRFRLERSRSGAESADEWEPCGGERVDVCCLVDELDPAPGGLDGYAYRVVLATPLDGTYTSRPLTRDGDVADHIALRAIAAGYQWRRNGRQAVLGWRRGWLLKRRRRGDAPADTPGVGARDPMTGEVAWTKAPATAGTEFEGGYYHPEPFLVERLRQAGTSGRRSPLGPEDRNALGLRVRAFNFPPVEEGDLFVEARSGDRFLAANVANQALAGHIPFVVTMDLRQIPRDDPAYRVRIPEGVRPPS